MTDKIFYSYKIKNELLDTKSAILINDDHKKIIDLKNEILNKLSKYEQEELIRPEIYKHDIAYNTLEGFQNQSIHLIFKPLEDVKILTRAKNILVLPEITISEEPLINLNKLYKVLTNSEKTYTELAKQGINTVKYSDDIAGFIKNELLS